MKVISYVASLLLLYLVFQGWSFLWGSHFLLPIGILVTMLTTGMVFIVTAEDRKKARSHRIFEEISNQYDREKHPSTEADN